MRWLERISPRYRAMAEKARCWDLVQQLTEAEGDAVLIPAGNADFVGPAWFVECCGGWTQWEARKFYGNTLRQCLEDAMLARETAAYG